MIGQIGKVLSANDLGKTGGHQAGILVPRNTRLLSFFPELDSRQYNPRVHLQFSDDSGSFWEFAFIYYNNRFFGGTRNEYRLTRMTKFIRQSGLVEGDEIILSRSGVIRYISFIKKRAVNSSAKTLKLGDGWRVIQI